MIDKLKLEEMVRDITVGGGEFMSSKALVREIEQRLGVRLDSTQAKIVNKANQICELEMNFP